MNEKGYGGAALGSNCAIQKSETLPSILDEIEKLAFSLKNGASMMADNLSGGIPEPKNPEQESGTIIGKAISIRSILRDATSHQQRTLNALAL